MLIRLRYGRRAQTYAKIAACLLIGVFYFAFLFRESLNAYEQNKERVNALGAAAGLEDGIATSNGNEIKPAPKLLKLARQQLRQKLQQHLLQQQKQQQQQHTTVSALATNASLAPSTLNPVYEYSEELHSATERELQKRRAQLQAVCHRHDLQAKYPPNPWEFFISPGHNLVWCNVFKAASSTWMYYFNILGGYELSFLQHTETQPLELARKRFPRPELPELLDSLPAALSFLFVRDPFERIVSAYRNKLEGGRNSFYKALGIRIAHHYRRRSLGGPRLRSGPTFEEFTRYVIAEHAAGHRFDEHWAPVYSFCTPCSVNFTIIGKVETFQRDSEFIIRQAGLESLLLGKLPRHRQRKIGNQAKGVKSEALVERYFADIERSTLDQLLKIYRMDFELFGYDYAKYYDIVQPWSMEATTTTTAAAAAAAAGAVHNATSGGAAAAAAMLASASTTTTTQQQQQQQQQQH